MMSTTLSFRGLAPPAAQHCRQSIGKNGAKKEGSLICLERMLPSQMSVRCLITS